MVFTLNDETKKNAYGFSVRTKGIGLSRFKANPVMMLDHGHNIDALIGRWINTKKDGGNLTAEPEFDAEDEVAKKVSGKVERGFLKGVSMGLQFNIDDMKQQPDGSFVLEKCELVEASICAVPANPGALKLYNPSGEQYESEQIQLYLSNTTKPKFNFNKSKTMKKVILSIAALTALDLQKANSEDGVDLSLVNEGIADLAKQLETAKAELNTANDSLKKAQGELQIIKDQQVADLVDLAVAEGKIKAADKQNWIDLAKSNLELAKNTLATLPTKAKLGAVVGNSSTEVKTREDFQKLTLTEQLAFKEEKPEEYKALFS